ncbi:helix-turn-helix transcriptional regulator [Candidatus Saccharibacteria bacterium]|nr:helix-turn-helix transcriptional regulator [Candidatus Saccharibacteria bacterium]
MAFTTPQPQVEKVEKKPGCIQAALRILGDKWTPLLVGQLVTEPRTFGDLETVLAGISPRTLSARLEALQDEGIIEKRQYNAHPPRYKYHLTEKGHGLTDILASMAAWGERYRD